MIYKAFQDLQLSQLGFGTMRLPLHKDKSIDEELAAAMTDAAIRQGVNYFDTAWPYHSGKSETVIGKILQNYPRESFYLADKFPGHQIAPTYDVADIFERQLKKCGVEYFDFYLLHNVYENSIGVYEDARWNIIPYLLEQKKIGTDRDCHCRKRLNLFFRCKTMGHSNHRKQCNQSHSCRIYHIPAPGIPYITNDGCHEFMKSRNGEITNNNCK